MNWSKQFRGWVKSAVAVTMLCSVAYVQGDVFSIDAQSPSINGLHQADVLQPGPFVHVGYEQFTGAQMLSPGDDLDALSSGQDVVDGSDIIHFSVDRDSQGAFTLDTGIPWLDAMTVNAQAGLNQQAGDIFVTTDLAGVQAMPGSGAHVLDVKQRDFGLVPTGVSFFDPTGLHTMPHSGQLDNLDAYSMEEFDFIGDDGFIDDEPLYFSLGADSPTLNNNSWSPADVLVDNPFGESVSVFISASDHLGLDAAGDDIDAMALSIITDSDGILDDVQMYFSLAPESQYLTDNNRSAADIFHYQATLVDGQITGGTFDVAYDYADLGLLSSDNVDALETNPAVVPEPATLALLGMGLAAVARRRRR